ncbi:MAG: isoprenylcysteine carboxylmethyltransferase family protein, partial [Candidatus Eremiobacteraeota bacterium]|nr:isoprenylcysteine carboxylmethyltransferase family protein [Candidatus Eremiobacteraeota bacterium]
MNRAFVFKHRGALLALPAVLLAACGKPSAKSAAAGIPIAVAGELLRCWAVGYSGTTTRADALQAPSLATAGPYAYVRNPLYVGNFVTALGFLIAYTGASSVRMRAALTALTLGSMAAVYATIVPYEEEFLRSEFGPAYERYRQYVPAIVPAFTGYDRAEGTWRPQTIAQAESRTF